MNTKSAKATCAVLESGNREACPLSQSNADAGVKLESILVPIDFSDGSKKALQYAVHFAKQLKASIILLHVLPVKEEKNQAEWAQRLKAWANEFAPNDIPVKTVTTCGTDAIEIVNEANKLAVGLMIISTHARTGRARALAGSLAENLVQRAPCPVLVVREREHDFIETGNKETQATKLAATKI